MQRTESTIVQVAPGYENLMTQTMEKFGWSLQGQQEVRETGDAYATRQDSGDYVIKTQVSQYVKLHFVRGLSLPNLDKIRRLESEYFGFLDPSFPKLFPPGGIAALILWGFLLIFYGLIVIVWPLYYFLYYKNHKADAEAQFQIVTRRRQEILSEVAGYLN